MQLTFVAALVAAASLAVAGCSDDGATAESVSAPSTQPGPVPVDADCSREPLPFRAVYLPQGWNPDLQIGEFRNYKADGSFTSEVAKSWRGPAKEAIGVYRDPPGIEPPIDSESVAVLGGQGEIGFNPPWHAPKETVISAAFPWCGFRWALLGVGGVTLEDVRKVAEGFVPLEDKAR